MTYADTVVTLISSPVVVPLTAAKFCWGGNSLLSTSISSVGTAVGYQWFFDSAPIAGASSSSYNATETGNYSCLITVPGSCSVSTATIHVIENPLPDPLVTFDGTRFHTQSYYVSYQWYMSLIPITGATSSSTPATGNGSYRVIVTDTNNCQSASTYYVLTGWNNIPEHSAEITANEREVNIYPNPASTIIHVESTEPVKAIISGMDGRELMRINDTKDINISELSNGVYVIVLYDANNCVIKVGKLIKTFD